MCKERPLRSGHHGPQLSGGFPLRHLPEEGGHPGHPGDGDYPRPRATYWPTTYTRRCPASWVSRRPSTSSGSRAGSPSPPTPIACGPGLGEEVTSTNDFDAIEIHNGPLHSRQQRTGGEACGQDVQALHRRERFARAVHGRKGLFRQRQGLLFSWRTSSGRSSQVRGKTGASTGQKTDSVSTASNA